jgi:hypothetical protein
MLLQTVRSETIPVPEAVRLIANNEDQKLTWHFLVFFSRMEYALKCSGRYLKAGARGSAEANWHKFGSDHDSVFNPGASQELSMAVGYFLEHPPLKQAVNGGRLAWAPPQKYDQKDLLLIWLFDRICCVRDNLFHGGKFPLIATSPSSDRELIVNAIVILRTALSLDSDVQAQFEREIEQP